MWHDHDIDFARWLHPAMWHVALESWQWITTWQHPAVWQMALGWHPIEFAQTSAILQFYTWFRFRPHHRSRHVILHQSPTFYPHQTTLGRKKMSSCRFSRWRISTILDFRDPIIGSLKIPIQLTKLLSFPENLVFASWRQHPRWRISLLSFWENRVFFAFWRQTDEQMDSTDALIRYRERRLNNTLIETCV